MHLVADAAEEGFVHEIVRIEIRREHQEDVEGHLELRAGVQGQVVDVAVERDDPAVEQVHRRDTLTSEVVDQEQAAVRFQLQRRVVDLRRGVREIERVQGELAARDDERSSAHDPASIEAHALLTGHRTMLGRIEDADEIVADLNDVRDEDRARQHAAEVRSDRRLAVAGRTEEEQ